MWRQIEKSRRMHCFPCRTRKIRCDGGIPECRNCIKRGERCPGYQDPSNLCTSIPNRSKYSITVSPLAERPEIEDRTWDLYLSCIDLSTEIFKQMHKTNQICEVTKKNFEDEVIRLKLWGARKDNTQTRAMFSRESDMKSTIQSFLVQIADLLTQNFSPILSGNQVVLAQSTRRLSHAIRHKSVLKETSPFLENNLETRFAYIIEDFRSYTMALMDMLPTIEHTILVLRRVHQKTSRPVENLSADSVSDVSTLVNKVIWESHVEFCSSMSEFMSQWLTEPQHVHELYVNEPIITPISYNVCLEGIIHHVPTMDFNLAMKNNWQYGILRLIRPPLSPSVPRLLRSSDEPRVCWECGLPFPNPTELEHHALFHVLKKYTIRRMIPLLTALWTVNPTWIGQISK